MKKSQIKQAQDFLDSRFQIALATDKQLGNENGDEFLPQNVDFIYYKGALKLIENLGGAWQRTPTGTHTIYF